MTIETRFEIGDRVKFAENDFPKPIPHTMKIFKITVISETDGTHIRYCGTDPNGGSYYGVPEDICDPL